MRKSLVSCVVVLLVLGLGACAAKQQVESDLPVAEGQAPAEAIKLHKAYGNLKEFCCQTPTICISGPVDGSATCRAVGGQPFQKSFCVAGQCVDP